MIGKEEDTMKLGFYKMWRLMEIGVEQSIVNHIVAFHKEDRESWKAAKKLSRILERERKDINGWFKGQAKKVKQK